MMPNRAGHGWVLPIGDSKLLGGLSHNPGQRSVVRVAHERAQMVDDVMVEAAGEPAHQWTLCGVVGSGRKDVIDAVVELVAVLWEVSAVNSVRGLEDEGYA